MNTLEHVAKIREELMDVECKHGCKVLFASVCGSRSYETNTFDSDCDSHFIFVYPKERYLNIETPPHCIRCADDVSGWELKFFLTNMVVKSAYTCNEMLHSPFIITGEENRQELLNIVNDFYNPHRLILSFAGYVNREVKKYTNADLRTEDVNKVKIKAAISAARLGMTGAVIDRRFGTDAQNIYPSVNINSLIEEFESTSYGNELLATAIKTLIDYRRGIACIDEENAVKFSKNIIDHFALLVSIILEKHKELMYKPNGSLKTLNDYFRKQIEFE